MYTPYKRRFERLSIEPSFPMKTTILRHFLRNVTHTQKSRLMSKQADVFDDFVSALFYKYKYLRPIDAMLAHNHSPFPGPRHTKQPLSVKVVVIPIRGWVRPPTF